jgi:hypothetical protein
MGDAQAHLDSELYIFGCVMNLRQNLITQEITQILSGNWADTRKEMQE